MVMPPRHDETRRKIWLNWPCNSMERVTKSFTSRFFSTTKAPSMRVAWVVSYSKLRKKKQLRWIGTHWKPKQSQQNMGKKVADTNQPRNRPWGFQIYNNIYIDIYQCNLEMPYLYIYMIMRIFQINIYLSPGSFATIFVWFLSRCHWTTPSSNETRMGWIHVVAHEENEGSRASLTGVLVNQLKWLTCSAFSMIRGMHDLIQS